MDLFKLFGIIAINNQEANEAVDATTEKVENAHPRIAAAFEKVGEVAVKAGKVIASGLAAGAAAIGALAKQSLDSYADYEQLVGGVETLFGTRGAKSVEEYAALVGKSVDAVSDEFEMLQDAQTLAMENAAKAYQTAGMSANEYMETVTSFAASLKQSTESELEAATVADMAVQDMADNANKMGTDMTSIQNAYQGFAKQNYTMLDNLKLGYGGTKEEMERLLQEASKLSGVEYNIDSLSDVYNAIHVVQEELGITGTTAKEASETISGSVSSMKSAWKNLLVGFADDSQDLGALISTLASSATTAAENIVPRIAEIFSGISAALPQVFAVVSAALPGLIEALLPGLVDGAVALVVGLIELLPSLVNMVFTDLPKLLTNALSQSTNPVVSFIGNLFDDIGVRWRGVLLPAIEEVGGAFGALIDAVQPIFALFAQLFTETTGVTDGFDLFHTICWAVKDALSVVADAIQSVADWINQHMPEIQATIQGVFDACQYAWDTIGQPLFDLVEKALEIVRNVFSEKMPEIKEFVSQCFTDIQTFWEDHLKPCFDAIGDFIENVLAPVFEEVFTNFIGPAVDTAFNTIKDLWNTTLKPVFTGITDFLTGIFTGNWKKAWDGIVSVAKGIFDGLVTVVKYPINQVINIVNSFIKGLNKLEIPDWVPLVGGKGINIPLIPKLEKGGILKKGQIGFLEGSGAEAVVPLDQNRAWISAVASDMKAETTGVDNGKLQQIIDLLETLIELMPESMRDAIAAMKFNINNREFARLVKAVD